MAIVSNLRRSIALAAAVAAFVPATASAEPTSSAPAGLGTHATSEKLELGATVLAGGSVALLVFGTIGMATLGDRRHFTATR